MPKKRTRIYNDKRARKYRNIHEVNGLGWAKKGTLKKTGRKKKR